MTFEKLEKTIFLIEVRKIRSNSELEKHSLKPIRWAGVEPRIHTWQIVADDPDLESVERLMDEPANH